MGFEKTKNILAKVLNQRGLSQPAQAAWICRMGQIILDQQFKDPNLIVANFKNKTLQINVPTAGWAQEIEFKKTRLILKINRRLKMKLIQKIKTRIV